MTYTTVNRNLLISTKREGEFHEGVPKSCAYAVGLQIPRGIYPETEEESDLWKFATAPRRDIPGVGEAQGVGSSRKAPDAGSRAHVPARTTEIFGVSRGGYIKGKSAIAIARRFGGRTRNFTGEVFWARGYFVTTVGLDEEMVRSYIRNQEQEDERDDQMKLGVLPPWRFTV